MEEIEVKILEVDPEALKQWIVEIGGQPEFDKIFEAWFFDHPNGEIRERGDLLRLRQEGTQGMLAYKQKLSQEGAKVMKETETEVGDANLMKEILLASGFVVTKFTRKRRQQFLWEDCHFVIDDYEGDLAAIPPFLEIEAPSISRLNDALKALQIDESKALPWSTYDLALHYGVENKA